MSHKRQSSGEPHIHEDVMKEIHEKNLTMKPRMYFIAGSALVGVGLAGTMMVSIFFTNVTLYRLRYDAVFDYLGYGYDGLGPFIIIFPWLPFSIACFGLIGGAILFRKYEISYKREHFHLAIALIALILTLGFLLDKAGTNKHVQKLSGMDLLYGSEDLRKPYVYGVVVQVDNNRAFVSTPFEEVVMLDMRDLQRDIVLPPGSVVRALGTWNDDVLVVKHLLVK